MDGSQPLWSTVANASTIASYIDMASKWVADKKFKTINTISAGVVWCLWLIRNDFGFLWIEMVRRQTCVQKTVEVREGLDTHCFKRLRRRISPYGATSWRIASRPPWQSLSEEIQTGEFEASSQSCSFGWKTLKLCNNA
jgi:hypothetical protein